MTTTSNGGADLRALMAIADRYARRLAAEVSSPPAVLLVERAGELEIVALDGEGRDVLPQVRLLLGRSGAGSAALLTEAPASQRGANGAGFWIFGESSDGTTARRRYRVRPCGRARRLTPLADGEDPEVEAVFRPLFPDHLTPGDMVGTVDGDTAPTPTTGRSVAA